MEASGRPIADELDPRIAAIAQAVREAGGRALVTGGYVRDRLLGLPGKDVDVEVLGLDRRTLARLLSRFGQTIDVGRSFAVLRIKGLDVDFSLPEPGERVGLDPAAGAGRRDLTINSMAFDPLGQELIDPFGGRRDLEAGLLRAVDLRRFGEDPLRVWRVAQFAARFEMRVDPSLTALCRSLDLSLVPGERLLEELRKLLLLARRPALGLSFMRESESIRFLPELAATIGVPQDPQWHPEGDVFVHTLLVVDEAASLRRGDEDDPALMFGALCHDLGKPLCTTLEGGRVRSLSHDRLGVEPTVALLERLRAPRRLVARVTALVEHHLAPALFVKQGAGPKGYRRLARKLEASGVSLELLSRLARADHLGRTTPDALARTFPAGERFLACAARLAVEERGEPDVVMGRHLIARGLTPGRHFAAILARCREMQDELGERDPERILDRVLPS